MSTASPPSSPDPLNRASIPPGWGDTIVLLGRILIGGIFVQSGFDKLMGLDGFGAGLAAPGLATALLMIAFVIVATLISHRFWVLQAAERRTQSVHFAKNVAIIGGFLFLFVI